MNDYRLFYAIPDEWKTAFDIRSTGLKKDEWYFKITLMLDGTVHLHECIVQLLASGSNTVEVSCDKYLVGFVLRWVATENDRKAIMTLDNDKELMEYGEVSAIRIMKNLDRIIFGFDYCTVLEK